MEIGAVDLLFRARDLVAQGWTQHADARGADGRHIDPWDVAATEWSLLGAIVAALEERADDDHELPLGQLAFALDELSEVIDDDSLADWNDAPMRTKAEVTGALDAAAHARSAKLREPQPSSEN